MGKENLRTYPVTLIGEPFAARTTTAGVHGHDFYAPWGFTYARWGFAGAAVVQPGAAPEILITSFPTRQYPRRRLFGWIAPPRVKTGAEQKSLAIPEVLIGEPFAARNGGRGGRDRATFRGVLCASHHAGRATGTSGAVSILTHVDGTVIVVGAGFCCGCSGFASRVALLHVFVVGFFVSIVWMALGLPAGAACAARTSL
ncbi:unnamed protein product [Ectocarpus sp. 12 AP-2014]